MERITKMKAGRFMIPVSITEEGSRIYFQFGFNRDLMSEIKLMEGSKWHGFDEKNPRKVWSVKNSERNRFQISYLEHPGVKDPLNPYFHYDSPFVEIETPRKLYQHQVDLVKTGLTRHYCIFAAEPGTGKTLAAITVMEIAKVFDVFWVAPKSAMYAVQLEFDKWKTPVVPKFYTYESLKKLLEQWEEGKRPPQMVVFDEASRVKNHTAQRSQAAQFLADAIRHEWRHDGFVIEMTGTPAPKSPVDWWSLCEIACPGFIKEGSPEKLKKRLANIVMKESIQGGSYPEILNWWDDENKCQKCGKLPNAECHNPENAFDIEFYHPHQKSVNEVHALYQRMRGLVIVKFKKDCLDLPDKIYREIEIKPTQSILNMARMIEAKSTSAIQTLVLLRELSDGFQYTFVESSNKETCSRCRGSKCVTQTIDPEEPEYTLTPDEVSQSKRIDLITGEYIRSFNPQVITVSCPACYGTGEIGSLVRDCVAVKTPKEDALKDLLDEYEDIGRIVIYGGFTGSVDRITDICIKEGWEVIRVDGRGWFSPTLGLDPKSMILTFQGSKEKHSKIAFVGQAGAAGMGLTLTASPAIIYYSNDFNAESRAQSEDRIHRPGMDVNRGATIIDLIHLPSDRLVLNNLKKKKRLQEISMGELKSSLNEILQTDLFR